jgi:hypothetical protein
MRRFFLSLVLVVMCSTAAPVAVLAFNPFEGGTQCSAQGHQNDPGCNCSEKAQNSAACKATGADPISGTQGIFFDIANIVAYLAGAIAVIMILAGAFKFITSGTDVSTGSRTDTDVEDARRMIANALIGLAVIVLAKVIITYVIRRL